MEAAPVATEPDASVQLLSASGCVRRTVRMRVADADTAGTRSRRLPSRFGGSRCLRPSPEPLSA